MNTDIFKKAFCLVLYLFLIIAFSIPAFARFEGNTEVVAHIEAESSEICSSSLESSDIPESIIPSDNTDSETVKTGDSSVVWIIVLTISISMVVVIISFRNRNKKLN